MRGGAYLPEGLHSVKETAQLTGLSESTLRRLDNSGKVKTKRIKVGNSNYRAYTDEDILILKAARSDEIEDKIIFARNQLADLYSEKYKINSAFVEIEEKYLRDKKTIVVSFVLDSEETKKNVRDLFNGRLEIIPPKE